MSTTRRRSYVSKPTFQIKLTIIFMLMVTIVANLVGGLCYQDTRYQEFRNLDSTSGQLVFRLRVVHPGDPYHRGTGVSHGANCP